MPITSLHDLFHHGLRDLLYAEKKLTRTLPKLSKAAESPELSAAFLKHADETEDQLQRLEKVFEMIDKRPRGKRCPAMDGLVEEGEEVVEETDKGPVRDTGLIAGAKSVEHYEVARYTALIELASQLGHEEAVTLLQQSLDEEKATDEKLAQLSATLAMTGAAAFMGHGQTGERGSRGGRSR